MKRAGAGVPSANRITLLRDADGDGVAETQTVFLEGLNSPFGMALVGSDLYVANTDARRARSRTRKARRAITKTGTRVAELPGGPLNHHWTKNVIASRDGSKLYATVGSNSNVAENGMDKEEGRAAIWEVDAKTGQQRALRDRPSQSERPGMGAGERRAVDRRQRARRDRQRPRARLPDVGEGRRVLRLAVQLLRRARRRARQAAAAGPGREGGRARLRARHARGAARAGVRRRQRAAAALRERRVHRRARLVEPQAAERATRSCSCRSRTASPRAIRCRCSPDS